MISSVFLRMVILSFNSIYKYELWLAISPNYSEDLWEYRKKTSCISRTDIALEHCSPKMSLRHRLWQLLNLTCPWRCGAGVGNAQGWTLGQVPFGFDRSNGSSFWAWVFGSFPHSVGKSPFGIGKSTVNEPFSIAMLNYHHLPRSTPDFCHLCWSPLHSTGCWMNPVVSCWDSSALIRGSQLHESRCVLKSQKGAPKIAMFWDIFVVYCLWFMVDVTL